jgi:hypothetical protein
VSAPETRDAVLVAALDVLLPGDADFPAASAVDLAGRLLGLSSLAPAAKAGADELGTTFLTLGSADRVIAMAALERDAPAVFSRFITSAYSGYYSTPAVLEAVERTSGYAARPPQPEGHALPPFDPAMLAVPAARKPSYRHVPEES